MVYKPEIEKIVPAGFDRTAAEIERNCSKGEMVFGVLCL